tara:strand:- start:147 stop:317 length:171 start_codon:yes stop_codon:yes gene_type:complete
MSDLMISQRQLRQKIGAALLISRSWGPIVLINIQSLHDDRPALMSILARCLFVFNS